MRKFMMAATALVAMAGAAQAQGASQQVNLTATVGGYCTIDGTANGLARSGTVATVNGRATGGTVTLDGASGQVICTGNAVIQLKSLNAGLLNPGSASAPYVNKIHYTASATYNGKTDTIDTSTAAANTFTAGVATAAGAQTNQPLVLTVTATATPPSSYLINGNYSDTLTVMLTPTP